MQMCNNEKAYLDYKKGIIKISNDDPSKYDRKGHQRSKSVIK